MAHSHSTQRFIPETLNWENLSYIHYIEFHHSLYNIYNVFRYSVDTKTPIPKTGIIFSKPLKIAKSAKNRKNRPKKNFWGVAPNAAHNQGEAYLPPPRTPLGKCSVHTTKLQVKGSSDTVVVSDVPTHTHMQRI